MNKFNKNLQKAISTSYSIIGSLFFFGLIGYLLNNKTGDFYWLIIFLILGAFVGLYDLYKQTNK